MKGWRWATVVALLVLLFAAARWGDVAERNDPYWFLPSEPVVLYFVGAGRCRTRPRDPLASGGPRGRERTIGSPRRRAEERGSLPDAAVPAAHSFGDRRRGPRGGRFRRGAGSAPPRGFGGRDPDRLLRRQHPDRDPRSAAGGLAHRRQGRRDPRGPPGSHRGRWSAIPRSSSRRTGSTAACDGNASTVQGGAPYSERYSGRAAGRADGVSKRPWNGWENGSP